MQNSATKNPSTTAADTTEPQNNPTFRKRIRTTNYIVGVHFSTTAKENVNDKVLRLIKGDIAKSHKANSQQQRYHTEKLYGAFSIYATLKIQNLKGAITMPKTTAEKIALKREQIRQFQNEEKQLIQKQKKEERAARTRRFCSRP